MKTFKPRKYQEIAISHAEKHPRCAIWLFMGAGKSAIILKLLDMLSLTEQVFPAIIFAPLRVASETWPDECKKWSDFSHIKIATVVGSEQDRIKALAQKADIYTCNYENIPWLHEYLGEDYWPFRTIVADESIKLKSFRPRQGGARAKALGKVAFKPNVKRFIELTGAPSTHGLDDLYGQVYFLDQGERLGKTYTSFRQRWFQRGWDGYSVMPLPFAQEQIQNRVKDICLSLDAKDYFDVKAPVITPVHVTLPPNARKLYNDMEKHLFMEIQGNSVEAFSAASRSNKCLQIANGAVYLNPDVTEDWDKGAKRWNLVHDLKLEAAEQIINELGGASVLVTYYYRSDLDRLKKYFPKGRKFDSDPQTKKDFVAGKFQIMFIHPGSAGHGVDGLQYVCNTIINFAHTWNYDEYVQLMERIGPVRQLQAGFDRAVFQYDIICRNTVDEDVIRRRGTRKTVQEALLEAAKYREVAR